MTKWHNFGLSVTDETVKGDIVEELEDYGLQVYSTREGQVKAAENARNVEVSDVLQILESYTDVITVVLVVTGNDTSDTASASVYEVQDTAFEQTRTAHSGGQDSRHDWYGVMEDGVSLDGGKYY